MPRIAQSLKQELPLWRYFFWDIPCWAVGWSSQHRWRRIQSALQKDAFTLRNSLQKFYADKENTVDIENAVNKALLIRAIRNSEAYSCLGMSKKNAQKNFTVTGIEHLHLAKEQNRPVILLTAHMGSFYTLPILLAPYGFRLNTVARTVDNSHFNPLPQQLFERLNYRLTEARMPGRYVYTNYSNKMDRYIVTACKENETLLVLPDIPRKFLPSNRCSVQFLGKKSSFPGRIIDLGLKYNAVFLTLWSTFELEPNFSFMRHLHVDPPITATDKKEILQYYADRLSNIVYQEPWQWLGSMIISQYNEETG